MQIETTFLSDVLILTPARFGDERGFFSESWNRRTLSEAGVNLPDFVQDNHSLSRRAGTVRG
ncbi:dTDP-4-dehydrorhamnose 3,5-epimerase family protein, partial [Paracoccus sp. KCTC 42845]